MRLTSQSRKRVRIWRGTRAPIRAYEGDRSRLPSRDEIQQALAEAATAAAQRPDRWRNRDRSVPANKWSGKA